MTPLLSVIIPTRGRPERLMACLGTLARVRPPRDGWEVIVVDDGSAPPLPDEVATAAPSLPIRVVRQPPSGLNAARNHGAATAHGRLLAFLDDDTLVDPGWAQALAQAFSDPACDAVGGRVTLRLEGAAPPWLTPKLRRYLAEYDLGDVPRDLPGEPVPVGANCAVRRTALELAGGFVAGLDRNGASLVSNGDTELFRRLQDRGGRIRYVPRARVEHCVAPDRLTVEFFRRRAHAQGASDALLAAGEGRSGSLVRELVRAGRTAPIAARGVMAGRGATTAQFWLQYCRGRASVVRRSDPVQAR